MIDIIGEFNQKDYDVSIILFDEEIGIHILLVSIETLDEVLLSRKNFCVDNEGEKYEVSILDVENALKFYSTFLKKGGDIIAFFFDKNCNFINIEEGYIKYISNADIYELLIYNSISIPAKFFDPEHKIESDYTFFELDKQMLEMIIKSKNELPFYNFPKVKITHFEDIYNHFIQNEDIKNKNILSIGFNEKEGIIDSYSFECSIDEVLASDDEISVSMKTVFLKKSTQE